ncbi:hypothetical protein ACS0TY_027529 [Phlomoides rotata]
MGYVDHAFSISDEDIIMETSYNISNKPPIKEIALAVALQPAASTGTAATVMCANQNGGDGDSSSLPPIAIVGDDLQNLIFFSF